MKRMDTQCNAKRFTGPIAQHLWAQGISGRELARRLNVSHAYVSRRLSGEVDCSATDLVNIAEALDLPISALLSEDAR